MEIIQQFEQTIDILLTEITEFKHKLYNLNQCEEIINKTKHNVNLQITENTPLQRKLQIKEGEWDRLNEYHYRNKMILENKTFLNNLIVKFHNNFLSITENAETNKNESAKQINDLLNEMKKLEKVVNDKRYTKQYKEEYYEKMFIESE